MLSFGLASQIPNPPFPRRVRSPVEHTLLGSPPNYVLSRGALGRELTPFREMLG